MILFLEPQNLKKNVKIIYKYFLDTSVKSLEKLFSGKMDLSILTFTLHVKVIKIGHQTQYRIHASVSHFLNSINLIFIINHVHFKHLPGEKCVSPPVPDASSKLVLSWNPSFPPSHNKTVTYR